MVLRCKERTHPPACQVTHSFHPPSHPTHASSDLKPMRPCLSSGGKYVPPSTGSREGVRKTDIGQPPPPWVACTYVM